MKFSDEDIREMNERAKTLFPPHRRRGIPPQMTHVRLAEIFGVGIRCIVSWIKNGELEATQVVRTRKPRKAWMITRMSVEAFMKKREVVQFKGGRKSEPDGYPLPKVKKCQFRLCPYYFYPLCPNGRYCDGECCLRAQADRDRRRILTERDAIFRRKVQQEFS